jgi:hypothetical protein
VIHTWWPLALSWLLMAAELPLMSMVVARLRQPEIHLAAYGGVVFPLALLIESPVIMLLAASTALSRDLASFRLLRLFMHLSGLVLTLLHVLVAFTPLYWIVARDLLGAPEEVLPAARLGLMVMTPWTWAIGYRRFLQGVLIRFGHSRAVGTGTLVRLGSNLTTLLVCGFVLELQGIVAATAAVIAGVVMEAAFVSWRVQPVVTKQLPQQPAVVPGLGWARFARFYTPLALTEFIVLVGMPLQAAALGRMPLALESLAVWPVLGGSLFLLESLGMAYNEVVVALVERPDGPRVLGRVALMGAGGATLVLVVVAATPLAAWWFGGVAGLAPSLVELACSAIWLGIPIVAVGTVKSYYQGRLVAAHRTRGIPESVALMLVACVGLLAAGVAWGRVPGLPVVLAAISVGEVAQTVWLSWRARCLGGASGVA